MEIAGLDVILDFEQAPFSMSELLGALLAAGFAVQADRDQLRWIEESITAFAHGQRNPGFPDLHLRHDGFRQTIRIFFMDAEPEGFGPGGTLLMTVCFPEGDIFSRIPQLSPLGLAVVPVLMEQFALRLPVFLAELTEELDSVSLWEALQHQQRPQGKVLLLSPRALTSVDAEVFRRWGDVKHLMNGYVLICQNWNV